MNSSHRSSVIGRWSLAFRRRKLPINDERLRSAFLQLLLPSQNSGFVGLGFLVGVVGHEAEILTGLRESLQSSVVGRQRILGELCGIPLHPLRLKILTTKFAKRIGKVRNGLADE